ncbi:MAG: ABC transporter ATP-binding protein [Firmicutes bacterium]|nr:ABC transporter ATP-binding protein [Bacillota bacterium]
MTDISLKNLTKSFNNKLVIDSLNLSIKSGEMVALLGPSGCGKTTTLKMLAGLIKPNSGDIFFKDQSILNIPTEKRGAILVFQDYLLFPHLNVASNISFGLKMRGCPLNYRRKRVKELLSLVNLEGYENHYPHELSGGQQQRISLARALAINPEVLLLDEPISNLDANLREEMRELILEIHSREEMTTIFVTHDREEAMLVADKIAVMNQGKIEQFGRPEKLYREPVSKFVAEFFGQANYINGTINGSSFIFEQGEIPVCAVLSKKIGDGRVTGMIRPEFIKFQTDSFSKEDSDYYLPGEIKKINFAGERVYYQVQLKDLFFRVTSLYQNDFQLGDRITLKIKPENIWFLE